MSREAQRLFALDEAIILDPSYTAKAAGAMFDLIRKGELGKAQSVVFVHTGGVPAQFAKDLTYDESRLHVLSRKETLARVRPAG
jgi:1-aminocyclopropane-1-carboxylate deaminase/D-cysteine desulfhydrase-like pyridoxal-dependent ACC family enzyme